MEQYRSLKSYLKETFGCRVYKVTLDMGLTCPNRDGTLGYGGCIYCNDRGSGTGAHAKGISISKQIENGITALKKRYNAEKFIAYFQSFTNSYGDFSYIKKNLDTAFAHPEVAAISVGTRPDCLSHEFTNLLSTYNKEKNIWLELGLQSSSDKTLALINRGHDARSFLNALKMTDNYGFHRVAHIILGLPEEGKVQFNATAKLLAESGVEGVKIHLLYVPKNNRLYKLYIDGKYKPLEEREYVDIVCNFIELLPPEMVIHRLTGDAHKGELTAPLWSVNKSKVLLEITKEFEKRKTCQGARYEKR